MIRTGSLVLYKNRPARVVDAGERFEIELDGDERRKVRPKDVTLLHPGSVGSLDELTPQAGEVETAWEILAGSATTLVELAELVYGDYTPATAWAAWQLVDDGLYFRGTPEEVVACSAEEVAETRAALEARQAEKEAWAAFLARAQAGRFAAEDERYLREVEALALEQQSKSRVLRELGRAETRENAHALLLELGYWDGHHNPHPRRLGVATAPPDLDLLPLPEEPRLDLTHLPAFAIDDEGSQDPDDALSLDGDRLWVHVADVAPLVPPGSPVDLEARARGATLYLPEGTVPMLPPAAARRLGLGLDDPRRAPALSFGLDLTGDLEIAGVEVVPTWVRVQRLTYEEVEARLDEAPFRDLFRLAQAFEARRAANGAISLEFPEVKVRVVDGQVRIRPLPPLKSRDLVREAMLLAGEAAARFARERDIPFPFTTQEPPAEQLAEPAAPAGSLAGMFALRRTLKRSQVKSIPGPHAGLGLEIYSQVTSPLRRYLDLVAHQQLRAFLRGEEVLGTQELLERVGAAEAVIGSVRQAERLACQHWTLVYLQQHPGWRGEGVLVDRRGSRGTVLVPELDLESQVHLREDLPLDSVVPLTLNQVDLAALEAHFRVEP